MKNKRLKRQDYKTLQRGIFIRVVVITAVAILVVIFLRNLTLGSIANRLVYLIQHVFNIDYESAHTVYQLVIRNNMEYIIYAAIAVFFVILSRFLLIQFDKYFNEISSGLDVLVGNKGGEIELSPEIAAMERKLKVVKQTLEEREQEVKSVEQRKNDVVMYLAHDIKTPLTSVIGYLSLLNEAPDMPTEQKAKYIKITLEKANRLERLVDEFFEITRYSFQSDLLAKESIDLYYMLMQMTDEFYPLLAAKGKQVILNMPEDMIIYGEPDKLARVFNNVLKNAISYSPENSVIDITATAADTFASIIFSNPGNIPKGKLASIFEKFYRLDSSRSSNTGGAGLGLSIAKEIVLSHGGRIYADSYGNKIAFTIELPVTREGS